jgi:hypothetical protein
MPKTLVAEPARGQVQSTVSEELLRRAIMPGLKAGLEQLGERGRTDLMDSLSVPVQYEGNKVIRSAEGDPPRMEEDMLRQSVDDNVFMQGEMPVLRISMGPRPGGDEDAAEVLEWGGLSSWGEVRARPAVRPLKTRLEGYAKDEIADGIRRTLGKK